MNLFNSMLYIILQQGEYMQEDDHLCEYRSEMEIIFILLNLDEFNKSLEFI